MFGLSIKNLKVIAITVAGTTAIHATAHLYLFVERQVVRGVQSARVASAEAMVPGLDVESLKAKLEGDPLEGMTTERNIELWINDSADAHGVNRELLWAMMHQESRFNPGAVSSKGAIGLLQVMPANAKRCGGSPADLLDARFNIECAAIIVSEESEVYKDNLIKVLEVYNGGPKCLGGVCKETREYVAIITASLLKSGKRPPERKSSES